MGKIDISCPKCKASFKVDEVHLGKKCRCQKCGERFVILRPKDNQGPAQSVEVTRLIQQQDKPQIHVTEPVQSELQVTKPIEATAKQQGPRAPAETIPARKAGQAGDDIARTIAAPAEKDAAEIQREE